ncbi:MAG: acyl carrier protein [Lachnospiraceae bacterium]|nr:acyl carrier protein [Lachnospiraceae bacterium]
MLEKIREILAAQLALDPEDVTENANFRNDLGIDSLDLLALVMALEDEYAFDMTAEEMAELRTVSDLLKFMKDEGVTG